MDNLTLHNESEYVSVISHAELQIGFETLQIQHEAATSQLIRDNLFGYKEAGTVLASTFRRLENFYQTYSGEASTYLIVKNLNSLESIGGAGLGPLAGLPASEGIGEIRDLFITKKFRGLGLGTKLISLCIENAIKANYRSLYLETTPQMRNAQKLFIRFGFRPVIHNSTQQNFHQEAQTVPCYYMLESLPNSNP